MSFEHLITEDLAQTDQLIHQRLKSDVALTNQIAEHIIDSGGKRLRPKLVLLIANALGQCRHEHHLTAAIIELIHTATLLHDDVIDNSSLRRGKPTANVIWSNTASVLTGDYLYSRAFEMMVEIGDLRVLQLLATASNRISQGELLQLSNAHKPDINEEAYFLTIEQKTAMLFSAACEIPALISAKDQSELHLATRTYGTALGMAFQITDDIIDYLSDAETMGKNVGDDVQEGKMTLPLIRARQLCNAKARERLDQIIIQGDLQQIGFLQQVIQETKALDYCQEIATGYLKEAKQALIRLPDSPYRQALLAIADSLLLRLR